MNMKKFAVAALMLTLVVGLTSVAYAQDSMRASDTSNAKASAPPLKWVKGTIKADNGKTVLVADKDQKSWEIINPDAVKGHEGHHVNVQAHIYADKDQIHVMQVKMLKGSKSDSMSDMK